MSLLDTASLIVTPNGYKEGKLYSVIPSDGSGDLSVTRATTATRVNSQGLVELVPYNLMWYSEQFDNLSHWGLYQVSVTANSTTAPNGTNTADTITDSSTFGYPYQSVSLSNGVGSIVTFSVFLKRTNNDWVSVAASRTPGTTYGEFGVWFNLATGAIGSNFQAGAGVVVDSEITDEGNGWYRCSVTGYVSNAVGYVPYVFNSNADNSFTSSAGKSRYQWGAQLVEGSVAKDYQKTETKLNIPRLDYSNGTCPSILVEPQRTNLLTYSSSFDNGAWTSINATITANSIISPSGIQDAELLTSTSTNETGVFRLISVTGTNTWSVYAKKGTGKYFAVNTNTPVIAAKFDLETGQVVGTPSAGATASIQDAGNGWYRCIVTSSTSTNRFTTFITNNTTTTDFSSSVGLSCYIWGAQLEAGSYATSYIPTTSSSVTRNADVISKTGISSLIGQTEGTLFIDTYIDNIAAQTNDPVLFYVKGSVAEAYIEINDTGGVYGVFYDGSTSQGFIFANIGLTNGRHKMAFGYKNNDFVLYVDGVQVGTDTSGTVSGSLTEFGLQYYQDFYRGTQEVNASALWKTRLTNAQLATLTTI